jgi:hypothetical protein
MLLHAPTPRGTPLQVTQALDAVVASASPQDLRGVRTWSSHKVHTKIDWNLKKTLV